MKSDQLVYRMTPGCARGCQTGSKGSCIGYGYYPDPANMAARIRPVEIKRRLFICEPPLCRNSALAVTYQPPGTQRDGRCELKWFYGHSKGNTGPGKCSQMVLKKQGWCFRGRLRQILFVNNPHGFFKDGPGAVGKVRNAACPLRRLAMKRSGVAHILRSTPRCVARPMCCFSRSASRSGKMI